MRRKPIVLIILRRQEHCYLIVTVSRRSGLIVGHPVSQEGTLVTLQAVVDPLLLVSGYASDGHATYAEVVWPEGSQQVILEASKKSTQAKNSTPTCART